MSSVPKYLRPIQDAINSVCMANPERTNLARVIAAGISRLRVRPGEIHVLPERNLKESERLALLALFLTRPEQQAIADFVEAMLLEPVRNGEAAQTPPELL